jgi:hypothetical protein
MLRSGSGLRYVQNALPAGPAEADHRPVRRVRKRPQAGPEG